MSFSPALSVNYLVARTLLAVGGLLRVDGEDQQVVKHFYHVKGMLWH